MIYGITITVVRPPGTDEYGDPLPDEPTTHTIDECAIAIRTATEIPDRGRDGVVTSVTLYAPPGADLLRTDRVIIADGLVAGTYEIDGEPFEWRSPYTGWAPGIEAALRRAQG